MSAVQSQEQDILFATAVRMLDAIQYAMTGLNNFNGWDSELIIEIISQSSDHSLFDVAS